MYELLHDSEVVYVGQTRRPRTRFKVHYRLHGDEITGYRIVAEHTSRLAAMADEERRIAERHPRLNGTTSSPPSLARVYDRSC